MFLVSLLFSESDNAQAEQRKRGSACYAGLTTFLLSCRFYFYDKVSGILLTFVSYPDNYVLFALFVGVVTYVDRVCKVGSLYSVAVTVNVVAFDFGKVERFGTRFNGEFAADFEPYNLIDYVYADGFGNGFAVFARKSYGDGGCAFFNRVDLSVFCNGKNGRIARNLS